MDARGLTCLLFLSLLGTALHGADAGAKALPNPYCPVLTDEKSESGYMLEYQGKEVYFCCGKCERKFKADPEKYLHNLPQFQASAADGGHTAEGAVSEEDEEEGGAKTWPEFFGRLHLVAVHFPIALVVMAAFFEVLGLMVYRQALGATTRALLWVSAPCSMCTAAAGWVLASFESYSGEMGRIVFLHRWGGISLAVLLALTLILREKAERGGGERLRWVYRFGLLAAAVLTLLVGHWGGELVHGPEFMELPI